jgi:purine-binding chemotaxis protein CheW
LDFRQRLCPVFDIQAVLAQQPGAPDAAARNLIVVECDSLVLALGIDKYVESLELDAQTAAEPEGATAFVDQVFRYRGRGLSRLNLRYLTRSLQENIEGLLSLGGTAQDAGSSDRSGEIEMLGFTIDRLQFGIPIVDLVEVIEGYSVEPLFKTNAFLRGLINLRGQIIACVDLSQVLGLPPRKMEERNQYLLLQDNDRDLALSIDTITKKRRFLTSQVQPAQSILNEELGDYLLGIIEEEGGRIFVLSGPKIIASKYLEPYLEQG